MARKRDVVVGVIVGGSFLVAFVIFAFMIVGIMSGEGNFSMAGIGGGDVGVVEVFGAIDEVSGRVVIDDLDDWARNSSVKAIVLHVNSPGGGVAISQEIYDAILRVRREDKPVVVSMASVAASGGYYIACAADRIVANPGTLTGSIGVIFQFPTLGGLFEKIGVEYETVKSGELKDVGNLSRRMTKKEELMLKAVVMDTYEQFVQVVSEGRGMDPEEIYPIADGSIYTGSQALKYGLVDTLGGLEEAILLAADLAGVEGDPSVVRPYRREKTGLIDLLGSAVNEVTGQVSQRFSEPKLLYLYQ